ncbi:MAG: hypothetical protein K2J67_03430 [Lachnospiraceae bacterium]|nr:hypothetical protein [Lachnospiraceae bacterium]
MNTILSDKRMILFAVLILHFFLLPHLVPSQDTMGQEGLKRVIIQGLASLPAMFCLAGTILAEGIIWFRRKKREMAEIRKSFILIWLFLLCVNGWWCLAETGTLVHALQDWKNVSKTASIPGEHTGETQEDGIDCVSFQSWNIQKTSSMGVTRGYYLKNSARTFSFPLGKNLQRIRNLERYADQKLTIYYYHHSHVPVRICAGDQVLAGN